MDLISSLIGSLASRTALMRRRGNVRGGLLRLAVVLGITLSATFGLASKSHAESVDQMRGLVNQGVVGIMCGRTSASFLYFCEDMAFLVNDDVSYSLRAIPMVGSGAVRNVEDLLYLKGVDLTITFADTLDFMQRQGIHPNIKKTVRYVTRLWDTELHILAGKQYQTIYDLAGQKVNFSVRGSGTFLTMTNLFESLGIEVDVQHDNKKSALERLRRGEIAAMASNSSVPWGFAKDVGTDDGIHLLNIPSDAVPATYEPSALSASVYPNLIAPGSVVQTLRNPAVLLAYDWQEDNPRCAKVQRFVDALKQNFPKLLDAPHQPKWRDVDLNAEVSYLRRWDKTC